MAPSDPAGSAGGGSLRTESGASDDIVGAATRKDLDREEDNLFTRLYVHYAEKSVLFVEWVYESPQQW